EDGSPLGVHPPIGTVSQCTLVVNDDVWVINHPPPLLTRPRTRQHFEIDLRPTAPQNSWSGQRERLSAEGHVDAFECIDGACASRAQVMVAHEFARPTEVAHTLGQRMLLSCDHVSPANATYRRVMEVLDDPANPVGPWAGVIICDCDKRCRGECHAGAHCGDADR